VPRSFNSEKIKMEQKRTPNVYEITQQLLETVKKGENSMLVFNLCDNINSLVRHSNVPLAREYMKIAGECIQAEVSKLFPEQYQAHLSNAERIWGDIHKQIKN